MVTMRRGIVVAVSLATLGTGVLERAAEAAAAGPRTPAGTCSNRWTDIGSPYQAGDFSELLGVDIRTATDAWTVGFFSGQGGTQGLVDHWDGEAWSREALSTGNGLTFRDVEAVAADDVWTVGSRGGASHYDNVTVHRDGTGWTEVPSPTFQTSSILFAVEAVSSTDVWAVGRRGGPGINEHPIAMHWDGVQWTLERAGLPEFGAFTDLAVADGTVYAASSLANALDKQLFRWGAGTSTWLAVTEAPEMKFLDALPGGALWGADSSTDVYSQRDRVWTDHPLPRSRFIQELVDIAVVRPSAAVVVGHLLRPLQQYGMTIQRWNGSSWQDDSPSFSNPTTWLSAVDIADGRGFAVGSLARSGSTTREPLILTACGF